LRHGRCSAPGREKRKPHPANGYRQHRSVVTTALTTAAVRTGFGIQDPDKRFDTRHPK
jgi:hypothetical protein